MKLVIASDIHGSAYWCRKLMELVVQEQPDKLILLGDLLYHGPRNDLPRDYAPKQVIPMLCAHQDKILCVRGNCEAIDYIMLLRERGLGIIPACVGAAKSRLRPVLMTTCTTILGREREGP